MADEEADAWKAQKDKVEDALKFWITFLGLAADGKKKPVGEDCKKCLLCLIRLISWVESKHGTAGDNQPKRDPMQSGNPNDAWWKDLTGKSEKHGRVIRGPGLDNLTVPEVPKAVAKDADAPKKTTPLPGGGHNSADFTPEMSYFWGILKVLTSLDKPKTYLLDDCSGKHLLEAADAYNGGGDAKYKDKIKAAAKLIKCCDDIANAK